MKKKFHTKLVLSAVFATALSFVGCNIFNPTEDVRIKSDDAAALTYEGYLHFQKNEYTEARDYFDRAIAADSAYSEAWYGRAKCVLNQQPGLNLFQLISYAKIEEGQNAASKFMTMPDEDVQNISSGIDSVLYYLDPFIERDSTGRTDKRISFSNFANSYAILQMTKVALTVRKASLNLQSLFATDPNTGSIAINWSELTPSALGESTKETFSALAATAQTLKTNPEATNAIIREYVPGSELLTDTALILATDVMADQIISIAEVVNNSEIDRADVFLLVGNHMDDDGDGCVDEEVFDGEDNDGDGEVDEDLRANNTTTREFDVRIHSPIQVMKVTSPEDYQLVDIDGDGLMGEVDEKEYKFIIEKSNDRKDVGDHRFRFAANFGWYGSTIEERIANKELVRHDTDINNIKYDLDWRKNYVGGCWANYDQARFLKWFEGRK
ncbi:MULTISPECIES: tetratricopeptide repeat protein [unclassified Fibrobacter]|uniref:tetratricopeptide repeat protein n=1 Tax=unclassified Fibrobacter TaxID=2634177 RepID=UPI000D6B4171|nr:MULTISPECIES: tetratricopeptide repeat protein [unclassified Fibrobacter]PWJ59795.1 hypothetical protein BGX12_1384 [Fibrobacter sp. UWR4]PZW63750.1 hypothetical protein C8E88_10404 [Fibrobacter sp. UWR1]